MSLALRWPRPYREEKYVVRRNIFPESLSPMGKVARAGRRRGFRTFAILVVHLGSPGSKAAGCGELSLKRKVLAKAVFQAACRDQSSSVRFRAAVAELDT